MHVRGIISTPLRLNMKESIADKKEFFKLANNATAESGCGSAAASATNPTTAVAAGGEDVAVIVRVIWIS